MREQKLNSIAMKVAPTLLTEYGRLSHSTPTNMVNDAKTTERQYNKRHKDTGFVSTLGTEHPVHAQIEINHHTKSKAASGRPEIMEVQELNTGH